MQRQSMQRRAWIHAAAPMITGAMCLMLRWLQYINVFDEETGLPNASVLSRLVTIAFVLSALVLIGLSQSLRRFYTPYDPDEAFDAPPKLLIGVLGAAAMVSAVGAVALYFLGNDLLLKLTALLALLSVPAMMLYPILSRWGFLGALMGLVPIAFFGWWLVIAYRENAPDPVLWLYAPQILSIAALLLATYRVTAYIYYRAKPVAAIRACSLAALFSVSTLMDEHIGMGRFILAGWAFAMMAIIWLLVCNMQPPEVHVDAEEGIYG